MTHTQVGLIVGNKKTVRHDQGVLEVPPLVMEIFVRTMGGDQSHDDSDDDDASDDNG
ncbi:hypothetical protein [Arthrobacter psychrochitiniphilus]|uniref:hypothetical protein n=1 Tax=Arthrobacter psychrochitiniphilus TaxID=291045 RepID=UPI0014727CC7|nr:hypothetical protein [Arthrobacter psychrochitiniphilus]NYG16962.1 hypothetical protein [Arthrobacter psychrochitiniphilus]